MHCLGESLRRRTIPAEGEHPAGKRNNDQADEDAIREIETDLTSLGIDAIPMPVRQPSLTGGFSSSTILNSGWTARRQGSTT